MPDVNELLRLAVASLAAGNLPDADFWGRAAAVSMPRHPAAYTIIGRVALELKEPTLAAVWFRRALNADPTFLEARRSLEEAQCAAAQPRSATPKRFLVIKPWSAGFFSEVDHLLGWLLLAELSRRTPIVHWGDGFFFSDDTSSDCFGEFFEPINGLALSDVRGTGHAYFPRSWNDANLHREDLYKCRGPSPHRSPVGVRAATEAVAVADMFCHVADIFHLIPPEHPLHGKSLEVMYLTLIRKYVRPRTEILAEVDAFVRRALTPGPVVAVHVRGGDKSGEDLGLNAKNEQLFQAARAAVDRHSASRVFLLTDSQWELERFKSQFGARLVTTQSLRTRSSDGVHYQRHDSRVRLGREVLIDALVAMRCDAFVGIPSSNVASFIGFAKEWPPGAITHIGDSNWVRMTQFWRLEDLEIPRPV